MNGWFDERETSYMEEVLKSDIGDHLGQSNVFEMLTLDRKIRFFKRALAKCSREHISGYEAGAFHAGPILVFALSRAFWKCFSPSEIGLLVNEWVLFEKYMQLLHNVGERKILLARKQILKGGLDQLSLHPGNVQSLITLKLSGVRLEEAKDSLPEMELIPSPRGCWNFSSSPTAFSMISTQSGPSASSKRSVGRRTCPCPGRMTSRAHGPVPEPLPPT